MRRTMTAIAMVLWCTSCTTATVTRTNFSQVNARIVDGDEQAIWVVPDGSGQVVRVPRQEVRAIEHPGDGWVITGVVLIGMGLLSAGTMGLIGMQEGIGPDLVMPLGASLSYVGVGSILWYTGRNLKESSLRRSQRSVGVGWSTAF